MHQHSVAPVMREPIRTREAGWPTIVLFLVGSAGLILLLLFVQREGPLAPLLGGPAWWENLVFFGSLTFGVVGGVLIGVGRLAPADLGLRRNQLIEGAIVTAAAWLALQVAAAIPTVIASRTIHIATTWTPDGTGPALRWTAVMFLGAALYEEITARGFLFPQLFLKLRGSPRVRFWTAVAVSQGFFAVSHIPAHLVIRHLSGRALWMTVALQGLAGVLLLLLYLRTRNLWISVGIHGLANAPTPLVRGATEWEFALIGLLLAWPWLVRRASQRGLAEVQARNELHAVPSAPPGHANTAGATELPA